METVVKAAGKTNYERVIDILRLEASAVERAAGRLVSTQVERAVEIIAACQSKVIVLGVGKSGVIAQKIAQTMTSTGTVAIYVHPSDALHGSLGVVTEGDVVIALSNSGETDEIVAMLPALKQRAIPIVAIVGNVGSTLARDSDVALDASVDEEACPLNLAPTTSTTVALSIGDALAMTVMEAKGHTAEDFAANHPAGRLGKRLTLRVRDLMHASPEVSPDAGWLNVVKAISDASLGAVNVVDEGRLAGIITDGDLRRTIERTEPTKLSSLAAKVMMTRSPITASPEMRAYDALRIMEERPSQISVLPVVDNEGKCIGLLRIHDVVKAGL
ncbi:MAG TPA: KpsF/GutQ family sugar-phosphate isomerase [Pyrinomonadaceae bacterium]|nr:KpsF/GutQ family sugar-phosphate isomerase [Pyrinomonadaceae bacterium]HMP65665.1 KpsF/GutQ family sugar-phosphate isomerase [Pyrinomonadaceae bacterium]